MEKTEVNGETPNKAYQYLRKMSDLGGADIPWNFGKFLVNKDGDVVAYYGPQRSPESMKSDIDTLLAMA